MSLSPLKGAPYRGVRRKADQSNTGLLCWPLLEKQHSAPASPRRAGRRAASGCRALTPSRRLFPCRNLPRSARPQVPPGTSGKNPETSTQVQEEGSLSVETRPGLHPSPLLSKCLSLQEEGQHHRVLCQMLTKSTKPVPSSETSPEGVRAVTTTTVVGRPGAAWKTEGQGPPPMEFHSLLRSAR